MQFSHLLFAKANLVVNIPKKLCHSHHRDIKFLAKCIAFATYRIDEDLTAQAGQMVSYSF